MRKRHPFIEDVELDEDGRVFDVSSGSPVLVPVQGRFAVVTRWDRDTGKRVVAFDVERAVRELFADEPTFGDEVYEELPQDPELAKGYPVEGDPSAPVPWPLADDGGKKKPRKRRARRKKQP